MFKIFGVIIFLLFLIIALVLIISLINHKRQLRKEAKEFFPSGNISEVNDKKIHIHTEGQGKETLVFMAGHGTTSPTLDFKPLWSKMINDYRIAVVEKSGYGWSEVSNIPKRDIETMLEETRQALKLSGVKPPFVLFAHSISGLESIYWAQKYPDEVKAIIGLDPCTPKAVELIPKPNESQLNFMYFISRVGLTRFMPEKDVGKNLPLMKSNELSEEDKNKYLAIFYKSAFTKDMLCEINYMKENAKVVANKKVPFNTPMLFYISSEQNETIKGWKESLVSYLNKVQLSKYIELATSHYVHYKKSEYIAKSSKSFLERLE